MEWLDGRGPSRSSATSRQGPPGSGVGLSGSGGSGLAAIWHPWQALQCLSAALSTPAHQTLVLRWCFVPTMPRWPSWASASARVGKAWGSTIRVPLRTRYPILQSSFAMTAYGWHFSKCPVSMALCTSWSSWSVADASSTSREWRLWSRVHCHKPYVLLSDSFFLLCVLLWTGTAVGEEPISLFVHMVLSGFVLSQAQTSPNASLSVWEYLCSQSIKLQLT